MSAVRHELTAEGMVRLVVPACGLVTDADARRLAWGILNDLAPDEVIPVPQVVVRLAEGHRLDILRAVAGGLRTSTAISARLGQPVRMVQRYLAELVGDGRLFVAGLDASCGGPARIYALSIERGAAAPEA